MKKETKKEIKANVKWLEEQIDRIGMGPGMAPPHVALMPYDEPNEDGEYGIREMDGSKVWLPMETWRKIFEQCEYNEGTTFWGTPELEAYFDR